MFPKCILWSPVRDGKLLSKRTTVAQMVSNELRNGRQTAKPCGKMCKRVRRKIQCRKDSRKQDKAKLETAVIGALRIGDVRKALQMLNSAPIAAKTPETLERLRKLHPKGENPAPVEPQETIRMTQDVVRSALSFLAPVQQLVCLVTKPFLLQQCMRAKSFTFPTALTSAVNHFASGKAPKFLKRFVAGGVSIALEKSATAVKPLACGDPLRRLVGQMLLRGR